MKSEIFTLLVLLTLGSIVFNLVPVTLTVNGKTWLYEPDYIVVDRFYEAKKLFGNRQYLKAVPLSPLLRVGQPGRGFHSGGSFPMRLSPGAFESDRLGRPHGFTRVHAVDSAVFPTIPATTITFSVMANAHRIATTWAETEV